MASTLAIEISGLSKRFDLRRKKGPTYFSLQRLHAIRDVLRGSQKDDESKDQLWALRDIDLEVKRGEVLGVIGRNGAGKSTLLKILARVLRPTGGYARIHGQVASLLEMGMGFDRELTVRENILMYSLMNNVPEQEAAAQLEHIAAFAKLADQLDTPLHHCPSGSYIKLAFATVVSMRADVILADEVLAVGDAAFQEECIDHIRQGSGMGKAVLFVSHDMSAIRQICHRVVWLDKGRIIAKGGPDEIVAQYSESLLGKKGRNLQKKISLPALNIGVCASNGVIENVKLVSILGAEIGALSISSAACIEFHVSLSQDVDSFRIHVACFHDDRIVFSLTQPSYFLSQDSGNFLVGLQLPDHFFNEFTYEFKCVLEVVESGKNRMIESDKVLTVHVYNTSAEESAWGDWPWGRPGYICPLLDWQWQVVSTASSHGN